MKRYTIGYCLALIAFTATSGFSQNKNQYVIHGSITGFHTDEIYLSYSDGPYKKCIDSAKVINDHYELKGSVPYGERAFLTNYNIATTKFKNPTDMLEKLKQGFKTFTLVPGEYRISHEGNFPNIKISGPPALEDMRVLDEAMKVPASKHQLLADSIKIALGAKDSANVQRLHKQYVEMVQADRVSIYGKFIAQHPNSPIAYHAFEGLFGTDKIVAPAILDKYFDLLPKAVQLTEGGLAYRRLIDGALAFDTNGAIGSQAPDFALLDTAGKQVRLSDYKGKYVLLDFWASWCGPCRADNPHLVNAYKQFHSKGFDILSVSLDVKATQKKWSNAIRNDGLGAWTHVADLKNDPNEGIENLTNPAAKAFGVTAIPQNFLIDPNGKIIGRSLRNGDLERKLAQVLKL